MQSKVLCENTESNQEKSDPIELIIYDFMRESVRSKILNRLNIKKEDLKKDENNKYPEKYYKALEHVSEGIYYRLRSCKNHEDFMGYFSDSLCSSPHFLYTKNKENFLETYQRLAQYLLKRDDSWLEFKSLAMLSLSKIRYIWSKKENDSNGEINVEGSAE